MNFRYVFKTKTGLEVNSVYNIKELEYGYLPKSLALHYKSMELLRRDRGTERDYTNLWQEAFENDTVICSDGEQIFQGIIKYDSGSFFVVNDSTRVPLHKVIEINKSEELI